jgi:predicted ArsR family transcriptional regulator
MVAQQKDEPGTRQMILELLRRHRQMTALELSESLGIGAVGVRQHLTLLERDGLVQVSGLRRSIGRPSHLYELTTEAEHRFPKRYEYIALDVIKYVHEMGGDDAVEHVFVRRREDLVQKLRPQLQGLSRADQVATLTSLLAEQGYMCEFEQLPDGTLVLTEFNCPVDCIARKYSQICSQELKLYEELFGVTIERESTISDGSHCCRYRIPA